MPEAPGTLEGWYALHDFRRIDWPRWKAVAAGEREEIVAEASAFLEDAEAHKDAEEGASALYQVVGHKADLMLLHLRPSIEELAELERRFAGTRLADFTTEPYSYVSITELGQYEASSRGGEGALENPLEVPFIKARLKPKIPPLRYMTFYPMNKSRTGQDNWYMLPLEERREMMRSHGTIGHKWHGKVIQMITGSVGLDDWEWGVTLFSQDPLHFKKLVYEMRFDEASARFAEFGPFLLGIRLRPADLGRALGT